MNSDGGPGHVLDATEIVRECWDELESKTIAACWTRSRCLSLCDLVDFASNCRDYSKAIERETVTQLFELLEDTQTMLWFSSLSYVAIKLCIMILVFNITSISDQTFLRTVGLAETAAVTGPDRRNIITKWLNIKENVDVIDDEIFYLVSHPINFDLHTYAGGGIPPLNHYSWTILVRLLKIPL